MADYSREFSSGIQGAQIGGQVGGAWGAVIGAGVGIFIGSEQRKAEKRVRDAYNAQVLRYAAQDLFDMRRAQNVENMRTAQALATLQNNRKVQTSAATAALGAAEIMGSSGVALQQALDFQTEEAMADTILNWEIGVENYNTQLERGFQQRAASLDRGNKQKQADVMGSVLSGINLYNSTFKGEGTNMMNQVKGWFSGQSSTPKAIERYDPRWKDMSGGSGKSVLGTLNANTSN